MTIKGYMLAGVTGVLAMGGVIASGAAAAPADKAAAPAAGAKIENQFICTFSANWAKGKNVRAEANRAATPQGGRVLFDYSHSIKGFAVRMSPQGVAKMQVANPHIDTCFADRVVALAPPAGKGPGGGGSEPAAQTTPWGIAYVGTSSGAGKTAWVIDSGIDLDHPDLNVDTARSADFTGSRKGADDENGHGTHVAGTIGAIDNSEGVIGVAAGAKVVAVRVLDRRGSGAWSGVMAGVDYVAANGSPGDVANMSLGGGANDTLDQAVLNASANSGVIFVLAAGNDGEDAANHSPARAAGASANDKVFAIASAYDTGNGTLAMNSWSNWGKPEVTFAEPGYQIESTWLDGGYNTISGTSMASPHAAGLMLLYGTNLNTQGSVTGPDGASYAVGVEG
ncbi:S8 family serine peptidase [Croceicoccus mobilis]|nr:S8 family serine peptidase [Croceicoccus mobilis]